jgi:ABC-2 type transport system ATP-binding protein
VSAETVITVRGLRKAYGDVEAVRGLDLDVYAGEVLAFLGPNGAGKTTTVEILEGFRERSEGEVSVLGEDPARASAGWRARIGVVLQESEPPGLLTVREALELFAGYFPKPLPVDETIAQVGLTAQAEQRAAKLSGDPELLFLDEPTTGFDPAARREAWEVITSLHELGKTVFLTTHYMEEAQRLADRVAIVKDGRIVASGPPAELAGSRAGVAIVSFTPPPGELPTLSAPPTPGTRGRVEVHTERLLEDLATLTGWARERDVDLPDLTVTRATLEDVYLELTA